MGVNPETAGLIFWHEYVCTVYIHTVRMPLGLTVIGDVCRVARWGLSRHHWSGDLRVAYHHRLVVSFAPGSDRAGKDAKTKMRFVDPDVRQEQLVRFVCYETKIPTRLTRRPETVVQCTA